MPNNEKQINHSWTEQIVCPHCGYEHEDSWDFYLNADDNSVRLFCYRCDKPFMSDREVEVTYTTRKELPNAKRH